jgi:hypothetical protein
VTDPRETVTALAELGFTEDIVAEAIRRGEQFRNSVTQHHPRTAGGFYAWSEVTTALRNQLVPLGGGAVTERGFDLCLCPTRCDVIAVLTGDRATGNPDMDPQPKYTKNRPAAQSTIESSQIEMFQQHTGVRAGPRLWFLLIRRDGDVVVAELSRPDAITDSGRINKWERRIILSPVSVGSTPTEKEDEYTPPVEIDVTPRE